MTFLLKVFSVTSQKTWKHSLQMKFSLVFIRDVSRRTLSETNLYLNERTEREDQLEKAEQDDLSRKVDWINELVIKAEEHRVGQ